VRDRVIEGTDAAEALAALAPQQVDILVTDLALRDGSGFELASKANQARANLKVIVFRSAERTAKVAGDLCQDGPLDHPYHPQHLVEKIRQFRHG
jgi:DNA-binding response OmpR family regulator